MNNIIENKKFQEALALASFFYDLEKEASMYGDLMQDVSLSAKDPRKTPAKPSERRKGSDKNKPDSASKPNDSIKFSDSTEERLKNKISTFNKGSNKYKATMSQVKAVYRRGAGAFSQTHHPKMSRDGWGMARVAAFLYLLKNERPKNSAYTQDNDLLPSSHPKSTK